MTRLAVILHSGSLHSERADEADTLVQVQELSAILQQLGWEVEPLAYEQEKTQIIHALQTLEPEIVVNLVESADGSDALSYRATELLDGLGLPYTGSSTSCLRLAGNKARLKQHLLRAGLATPAFWSAESPTEPLPASLPHGEYIIKSATEHCSLGLDNHSVVPFTQIRSALTSRMKRHGGTWFAEQYIEGREFHISMLSGQDEPEVLPIAEIVFHDLPSGTYRILDYSAKWDENSLLHTHTAREFPLLDGTLQHALETLAVNCWHAAGMGGYGRIDVRLDRHGRPWLIDLNINPCLNPGVSLMAACAEAGYSPQHVVQRILDDALVQHRRNAAAFMG